MIGVGIGLSAIALMARLGGGGGGGGGGTTPVLDLNFTTGTLDPLITFARSDASTCASYFDSAGLLKYAAPNVPRFNYNPASLLMRGLLVEETRTNLLTQSRDMTQGAWGKNALTVARNQVGLDGVANTACQLLEAVGTINHYTWSSTPASAISGGAAYTGSVAIKASGRTKAEVWLHDGSAGNGGYCFIDLSTGAISNVTNTGGTNTTARSVNLGGGWWRVELTTTNGASAITAQMRVYPNDGVAGHDAAYAGNASLGIIIDCAQIEVGARATSYIPTTTATVTRANDSALINGTNFSNWFTQSAGTLFVEGDMLQAPPSSSKYASISGVGMFELGLSAGANAQLRANFTFPTTSGSVADESTFKMAASFDSAGNSLVLNGGTAVGDTSIPSSNSFMYLGSSGGVGGFINAHLRAVKFYDTRMTTTQLQALTV